MRPNGPHVITDGVVPAFVVGHRAYSPSAEEVLAHQVLDDAFGFRLVDDSAPEKVADVGRQGIHAAFAAIEGKRVEAPILDPEILVEPTFERIGLSLEPRRELRVAPDLSRKSGAANLCVVDVALNLATCEWSRRERSVVEQDR